MHLPKQVRAGSPFDLELTLHNRRELLDAFNTQLVVVLPSKTKFSARSTWTAAGSAAPYCPVGNLTPEGLMRMSMV